MRLIKKMTSFPVIIGIVVIAVSLSLLIINRSSSQTASTSVSCSGFSMTVLPLASGTSTILTGNSIVNINPPASNNSQSISQIIMSASTTNTASNQSKVIGQAMPSGRNSTWNFKWATTLWLFTTSYVNLSAKVFFSGLSGSCTVSSSSYFINNSQLATMTATLIGPTDPVPVNSTSDYSVNSTISSDLISSSELLQYSIIDWSESTNIGNLSIAPNTFPNNAMRTFHSGLVPGVNTISANVIYGGAITTPTRSVTVKSLETPNITNSTTSSPNPIATNAPTTSTTTPTTDSTPSTLPTSVSSDTATITQITSSQVQVAPATKSCVEEVLTTNRYTEINSGVSRPTASESTNIATCFAPSKYILPSNFSPVDPVKVSDLEASDIVSVNNLENVTIKVDSKDKQTLKITGKTTPNSTVILYIYSDPLIITTKSDGDGNWQYTIEDPLEPGKHEVYAIVDNGDGVYKRSDPMSFLISTASASATNPNSLGLTLSEPPKKTPTQSNTNLIVYIVGSIAVLIVAFAGLYLIVRTHHKHKIKIAQINKSAVIDNLECPHCNNLVSGAKKNDVQPNPINASE